MAGPEELVSIYIVSDLETAAAWCSGSFARSVGHRNSHLGGRRGYAGTASAASRDVDRPRRWRVSPPSCAWRDSSRSKATIPGSRCRPKGEESDATEYSMDPDGCDSRRARRRLAGGGRQRQGQRLRRPGRRLVRRDHAGHAHLPRCARRRPDRQRHPSPLCRRRRRRRSVPRLEGQLRQPLAAAREVSARALARLRRVRRRRLQPAVRRRRRRQLGAQDRRRRRANRRPVGHGGRNHDLRSSAGLLRPRRRARPGLRRVQSETRRPHAVQEQEQLSRGHPHRQPLLAGERRPHRHRLRHSAGRRHRPRRRLS
jgi:hypothetical protein